MIFGIGTDIVDIRRIERLVATYGQKFLDKIYTPEEQQKAQQINNRSIRCAYLAKRFAAKEALAKAMGCGFGQYLDFLDISIHQDLKGKPLVTLSSKAKSYIIERINHLQKIKIDISLTDEYPMAQSFVIISLYGE